MKTLLRLFGAFFLVAFLVPYLRRLAVRFNIVDLPSNRKIHKRATPLLGGLAIFIGFFIGISFEPHLLRAAGPLLAGGAAILAINLVDDIRKEGLPARLRFVMETAVVLGVIWSGIRISFMPRGIIGNTLEVIITLIWFLGITNAFNFLDGLDGLAAGSACFNFYFFAILLYNADQMYLGLLSLILFGSCAGFLLHNFPRARVFLGDAGSTFIGFMLAGIAVMGNWGQDNVVKLCIPIVVLGVPIFDMTFTTVMRFREGKVRTLTEWLKYAGRDHFHHYLVDLGLFPIGSVLFIWGTTISLGISGLLLSNDKAMEGVLAIFQTTILFVILGALMVMGRRHRNRA